MPETPERECRAKASQLGSAQLRLQKLDFYYVFEDVCTARMTNKHDASFPLRPESS